MVAKVAGRLVAAALVLGWVWAAVPGRVLAHHSYSVYDSSKPTTIIGKIVAVAYQNPHVSARLDTGDRVWRLDMPGPRGLSGRGVTAEVLQVGLTVEVLGWPNRSGSDDFAPVRMTIDGRTFQIRREDRGR